MTTHKLHPGCGEEDDVGFLLTLIDHMIENRSVDASRVYLSGWSNGCFMSQEMAMVASHKITAIACMAGYTVEPKSADYSPIPVMEFHGFLDPGVLYGHSSTASFQVAGAVSSQYCNVSSSQPVNGSTVIIV